MGHHESFTFSHSVSCFMSFFEHLGISHFPSWLWVNESKVRISLPGVGTSHNQPKILTSELLSLQMATLRNMYWNHYWLQWFLHFISEMPRLRTTSVFANIKLKIYFQPPFPCPLISKMALPSPIGISLWQAAPPGLSEHCSSEGSANSQAHTTHILVFMWLVSR